MNATKKYLQDDKAIFDIELDVDYPHPPWDIEQNSTNTNDRVLECSICLQNITDHETVVTKCGHLFCRNCIRPLIAECKKCPMCNANANLDDLRTVYISK